MKLEAQERVQKHVRLARRLELWRQVAAGPVSAWLIRTVAVRHSALGLLAMASCSSTLIHTLIQCNLLAYLVLRDAYHLHESEALRVGISTKQYVHSVR